MPIEFRCTQCGKLLRTPDDTAGKQARCPECGAIGMVPIAIADPSAAAPAPLAPAQPATANPYQAPAINDERPRIVAGKITFGDVYGRAWRIFQRRWLLCSVVVAIAFALKWLVAYGLLHARVSLILAGAPANLVLVVSGITAVLVEWWLKTGQIYFFLNVAAGKPAKITDLLGGSRWFLTFLLAMILYLLAVFVGCMLLVVPGLIVWLMWSQYSYLIVDRNLGPLEVLRVSRQIVRGNKLELLWIYLASMVPAGIMAGSAIFAAPMTPWNRQLAPQLMFLVFTPWLGLLTTVCYRVLTRQPTADQTLDFQEAE